jgi:Spy/CpxP family protein refolding chaperone
MAMKSTRRTTMRTILTTMLLGTALLAAVPQASAFGMRGGGPGFMHGHGPGGGPGGPALRLLLSQMTADQRGQVRQILVADRDERRTLIRQLHAAHEALTDKMLAPGTVTDADVAPQIQQIATLHQQLLGHGAKVMLQVRAVATPDQLAKVAQTKARLDQLRGEIDTLLGRSADDDAPDAPAE